MLRAFSVTTPVQRKSSGGRSKPSATPSKRAGVTSSIQSGESLRRNNTNALPTPTSAAASRAYHQTHAYVVSQQQLLTSWHLPDYLAHLEAMLPTGIPRPLEVRSSAVAGARESMEHTMERGVKVRWPSKRTSVGDMTKRVRAILEWVGREQAAHAERQRRTDVLRLSLGAVMSSSSSPPVSADLTTSASTGQVLGSDVSASPMQEKDVLSTLARSCSSTDPASSAASILDPSKSTTALMEEIMEELIGFQEKYSRSRS